MNTLRGFLGGPGLMALFDAPWLPIFLLVIFLFHPLLGVVALAGALLMVLLAVLNERLTRKPLERAQTEGAPRRALHRRQRAQRRGGATRSACCRR